MRLYSRPMTTAGWHAAAASAPREEIGPASSILNRVDVAVVPLLVMSAAALAIAIGQILQPAGSTRAEHATALIVAGGIVFATIASALAWGLQTERGRRLTGTFWLYQLGAAVLLASLSVVALLDGATATVMLTGAVPMAAYVGFVFPRTWSRLTVGAMVLAVLAIHLGHPSLKLLDTAGIVGLILVGWLVGLIPRNQHRFGFRQAQLLSRSDVLTGCLNRRGFLAQLAFDLQRASPHSPAALIAIDLDDFKRINDASGHAAGDELLAWVGAVIPPLLPGDAAFGRLGGNEFGVLLANTAAPAALEFAAQLQRTVGVRIAASVGVATTDDGTAAANSLLDTAGQALMLAKHDTAAIVRHRTSPRASAPACQPVPRPAVTYAQLHAQRGPLTTDRGAITFDGRWMLGAFLAIAASGSIVVLATFLGSGDSFWQQVIRVLGVPWIIANVAIGIAYRHRLQLVASPLRFPTYASGALLGGGVAVAALASGDGAAAPIIGALFLKVLFDASVFQRRQALELFAIVAVFWLAVLALGPSSALWAAPFQAVLLIGSFALGSIGRDGFDAATAGHMELANTDELTGLLNRRGFQTTTEREVDRAATGAGTLALITIDLRGLRAINETQGHEGGDRTLQSVAGVLLNALPNAYAAGRVGGDEFMVAVPVDGPNDLTDQLTRLQDQLRDVNTGAVGEAVYGLDGHSLGELMRVADRRAYRGKATADRERRRTLRGAPRRRPASGATSGPSRGPGRGHGDARRGRPRR
jgi:diguanylate cyclase (GGDEF)-like protein